MMRRHLPSLQGTVFLLLGLVLGFILGILSITYLDLRHRAVYDIAQRDSAPLFTPSSHEEVNAIDAFNLAQGWLPMDLNADSPNHDDDDSVAEHLYEQVRVLVFVETYPANLETKARQVRNTWGKRANKLLFASDEYDPRYPTMNISVETGRSHLTAKTMGAFDYIYKHHIDDYDWFMKADDDTYVIMENLRYFLSNEDSNEPVFFGHWFKVKVEQGYYSGGGGYVISREALRRYGRRGPNACKNDTGAEDVAFGHCMFGLGVKTKSSLDNLGRSRFHALNPKRMLQGKFPGWYQMYDKYGASHKGVEGLSDYAITFHYCSMDVMDDLEYFVYHLKPYGIRAGIQDLNVDYSVRNTVHFESQQNRQNEDNEHHSKTTLETDDNDALHNSGEDEALFDDKIGGDKIASVNKMSDSNGKDGTSIHDNQHDNGAGLNPINEKPVDQPPVENTRTLELSRDSVKPQNIEKANLDQQIISSKSRLKA